MTAETMTISADPYLCPNHHAQAGPNAEALTPDQIYEYKKSPYNSDIVDHVFHFESNRPKMKFAGMIVETRDLDEMTILEINGEDVITMAYRDSLLEFSAKLRNESGNLVAEVNNNEWWVDSNEYWDLRYKPPSLKIWNKPRDIEFGVIYDSDNDFLTVRGQFYSDGVSVNAGPKAIELPHNNVVRGGHIVDCNS